MRLVTYNIHKGVGGSDRRYRLDRIVDVLRHVEADLICLQEVDFNVKRSRFDNQPAILADRLKVSDSLYQLNVPHRDGGYGNLLLSRWPFQLQHNVCIRHGTRKPRGAQLVVVDTPQGPLHLVNCHLGLAERERRWQVGHLLEHQLFRQSIRFPTLIAGDFNDWRNTLGKHRFSAHSLEQITSPIKKFRSFPAFFAVASLDKVYGCKSIQVDQAQVIRDKMARRASDHLPLVVDFALKPASEP